MRSMITSSLLTCGIMLGLSCGYAQESLSATNAPFIVPAALLMAGAPTFNIPTNKVVVLTANQLAAAEANHTIVDLINRSIESNTLIRFPAGTYDIPAVIFISGVTNVVLEGAVDGSGAPATTLHFTNSLTQLYGNNTKVYGSHGAWHGGGGLITIGAKHPEYANGVNKSSKNIGIKNLHITFNRTFYNIREEAGYNAFYFNNTSNSYAQNITVENFDSAFIVSNSNHTTVTDVKVNAIHNAHFAAVIYKGSYNLIQNLTALSATAHQLAVQQTSYNVFKNCTTAKGAGDGISYRGGSSHNLFWNIHSAETVLGASNGQNAHLASTYGQDEYYWNCTSHGVNFSASQVPAFLNGYVHAYYGPQASPF